MADGVNHLVLLRHGQSIWNREHRFTGWADVELTPTGLRQAEQAGKLLHQHRLKFDRIYCSELSRAGATLACVLAQAPQHAAPVVDWRLNERHNGALEGMTPLTAIMRFGLWPVLACQLLNHYPPPPLATTDPAFPGNKPRYQQLAIDCLPQSESLLDVRQRLAPFLEHPLRTDLQQHRNILVVAHKNLLRELMSLIVPQQKPKRLATARPWLYQFDAHSNLLQADYLDTIAY
ncbi:MAG: 2,3-bisphosphoglycerate-dependent phosphoglycerate mutase [Methylococcales bacterium]|nr:2,3-bisphosphoglycerate-dependent phosphoglycerate mutase [Methylococcales bacterium]